MRFRPFFSVAIFLASFLIFLVEPIAAKQLLPIFGGSAAIWITCLVFFQSALLCAYLFAHWLSRRSQSARSSAWNMHLVLLLLACCAAILWTLGIPGQMQPGAHPFLAIFAALGATIGLPFLVLGSTSPLLQVWLARIDTGLIPYRLYALSNLASLLALAIYPVYIEPNVTLHAQRLVWCGGFLLFALVSAILTRWTRAKLATPMAETPATGTETAFESNATPPLRRLLWLLLPMGAAMQLSAVTSHLTENIAPIPLLWILPLAVYLITLIVAFQAPRLLPRWISSRLLVVLLAGLGYMLAQPDGSLPLKISIFFFLAELFFACLFLHSEASALRPRRPAETTLFYLFFAAGGALGSFLIGIASPLIFSFNYDLALSFFVTAVLAFAVTWPSSATGPARWGPRLLWSSASILLLVLVFFLRTVSERSTPVAVRNFYGTLRVKQTVGYPGATIRTLSNGTIQHGTQIYTDELRRTPTTYYALDSGVGLAMASCCQRQPPNAGRNIGVVGLGAGTIAAYGRAGDRIRFYEINPAVLPIAQNVFTYLREASQAGAQITIVEGDARTSLSRELASPGPQNFDVLVIDAFSGDAIPLHLLTTQALELYKRHLAPGGILAFHISNQHVDLEPEVALLAKSAGFIAMRVSTPANEDRGEFSATWMLLSQDAGFFQSPDVFNHDSKPSENPNVRVWTDDDSSLLPILRW